MSTVEMKLGDMLDQAIADMPAEKRAVKRMLQRMASRPRVRAEMIDILAGKLASEPDLCDEPMATALNAEDFNGNVALAINPDNLKTILDFISKILPLILQIFVHV